MDITSTVSMTMLAHATIFYFEMFAELVDFHSMEG